MTNRIPNELAAALMAVSDLKEQVMSMHLMQLEALTSLIAQLHKSEVIDTQCITDHVLAVSQSPEMGELAPALAQMFCGRLAALTSDPAKVEDDVQPG